MKKKWGLVIILLLLIGCAKKIKTLPDGKNMTVFILSDRGFKESDPVTEEIARRNTVGQYLEENIIKLLRDEGYDVKLIQKKEEYIPASGKFLLKMTITGYNLRLRHNLFTRYELYVQAETPLIRWDDEAGTIKNWRKCVHVLNARALEKINAKIEEDIRQ